MNASLEKLGFDSKFLEDASSAEPGGCVPVRVTQVHKESYLIADGDGEVYAEATGKLMFSAESSLDLPVTGDWVMAQIVDRSLAVIHEILPRKSILRRKTAGKKTEFQAIASNIDTALIVQALDDDLSPRRLERYLIMVREGGIRPVVLLSKADLISEEAKTHRISEFLELSGDERVIAFSNTTYVNFAEIRNLLKPRKTFCLLGSSGVGKSTLLNKLFGGEVVATKGIREKDGKGRHTTTARELIMLPSGAMIIDTPGMRELGNIAATAGITETFEEISGLEGTCRFSDCSHVTEDGCAVLNALTEGSITQDRFASYMKMRKESEFNEASYLEIRHKHKKLGKLYKSIQKNNRKNKGIDH